MKTLTGPVRLATIGFLVILLSSGRPKDLRKNYIQFDKNLYAAWYEVTNKEYRVFLQAIKNEQEKYSQCA